MSNNNRRMCHSQPTQRKSVCDFFSRSEHTLFGIDFFAVYSPVKDRALSLPIPSPNQHLWIEFHKCFFSWTVGAELPRISGLRFWVFLVGNESRGDVIIR
jgi:hypothetical protein